MKGRILWKPKRFIILNWKELMKKSESSLENRLVKQAFLMPAPEFFTKEDVADAVE